jgi:PAS domain S-box-containing protein
MSQPTDADLLRAEAQARLAAIVESSDDGIVSKTLDGIITSWNDGARRIFGYTAEEAVGRSIAMLIPPGREEEEPQILRRLRAGERVDHFETVRVTKDGRRIDVSVTISPVRDGTGRIIGASKVARDVTEQKQIQRELQAAKDAADAANRSKDHFLSVLSHELRTPLTPVLAAISHIESDPRLPPSVLNEHIAMIRRNVETEARLVDDLLDLTRIMRGKIRLHFEVVDAHATLRTATAMLQADADAKGLSVTLAFTARSFHLWADPARLQQVFLNLLSNAVKFTPAGGAISIRSANGNDSSWRLELSDTGIGIEPDVLSRLFLPFEQGEHVVARQFGGLGLGLSIVKSMIEMHGGQVSATSAGRGMGASFVVELTTLSAADRAAAAAPSAEGAGTRDAGDVGGGRRILLVEDHTDTRVVLSRLLASLGFLVLAAGSVREALDLAQREKVDLLVSDIGLPDGSGVDLMRELKQRQPIKGIALSGFGQADDLRRSAEAGFLKHLTKPVSFATLREVIAKLAS